tara:strand:- start:11265 stop:11840 length:576 start_codon:yes stop_codon:yes gene_type:complete
MSCLLMSGRSEPCKDNLGGIEKIYIATYVEYLPSQYTVVDNELLAFPATGVVEFSARPEANTFTENWDGEIWSQTLNLQFNVKSIQMNLILKSMENNDLRVIVKLNNGTFKILGLNNGLTLESHNSESGGARADFNGYTVSFEGKELYQAAFITDPFSIGFITQGNILNYDLQNLFNFDFQNNINYNFQTS